MNGHHSFNAVANAWIATQRGLGRSPKSLYTYRSSLDNLWRFLRGRRIRHVHLVTAADLTAWQDHLRAARCAPATLGVFTLTVRRWFAWQVTAGRLFQSPARLLRTPQFTQPKTRCPSEEQMRWLLGGIKGQGRYALRDRAIMETAYATGARLAELAALDLASIDLKGRTVRLYGKGQQERVVPLTRAAAGALRRYLRMGRSRFPQPTHDRTILFLGIRGPLTKIGICRVVERRAAKIGMVLSPHDLRRAFATHLIAGGAHPTPVKDMLGHQGYKHLRHYLKLHPQAAINAVRRNRLFR